MIAARLLLGKTGTRERGFFFKRGKQRGGKEEEMFKKDEKIGLKDDNIQAGTLK